jgi:hypothetical protein
VNPELKERLRLVSQRELQALIVHDMLRSQGLDPEQLSCTSNIVLRVIDGQLFIALSIDSVMPHVAAPPPSKGAA